MRTFEPAPRRDYEEAFRSLGGVLDQQRLEDALLVEVEDGFLVTGLRRKAPEDGHPRRYEHAESTFRHADVNTASARGRGLRGSGRQAGRYEEALRLIGRRVNEEDGSLVLLLDQGDGFLLRSLSTAARDLPYRFATFRTVELDRLREESLQIRG